MSDAPSRYKAAHDLHYRDRNLDAAKAEYELVIEEFPDAPEAGYAKTQILNIESDMEPRVEPTVEERMTEGYACEGCNGQQPITRRVELFPVGGGLQPLSAHPYLSVSCGRCGYAQLYDLSVLDPDAATMPRRL